MGQKDVTLERISTAQRQDVWDMWVEPDNFAKWYGPKGASLPVCNMDVQVGGKRHFAMEMQTPNGPMKMWFVGEFIEVDEPSKLVYTEIMSNESGDELAPSAFGMPGDEVQQTTVTVLFETVDDGTKITMTHAGIPADSPGAQGWEMALDKFEKCLTLENGAE